ncbi:MAG: tRNA (adenosine(37)-N6)-dimethylallyltransferase MiaA [Ruminococcaceae bacterium]|nr:tRNA (adenosine(37)-N6)-dimethylallyltransferase MiaA [Oscillospiraceae bacterium]
MSTDKLIRPIFVVGPTASGKSALAVFLAEQLGGEVVSADSMQIYRGMCIGTAAPTEREMRGVRHHMVGVIDPKQPFSVGLYRDMAQPIISDLQSRGIVPIVVGGTGLYFDALLQSAEYAPVEADLRYRAELTALAEEKGNEAVHALLRSRDPETAARLHPNNLKRVIRALEVLKLTGVSISEHDRQTQLAEAAFDPIWIGINVEPRSELYARIDRRVDTMLADGLMDEIRTLTAAGLTAETTAMQAIGYKEFLPVLHGTCSVEDAAEEVKKRSRNYAKRQLTWFRRNERIHWFSYTERAEFPQTAEAVLAKIRSLLN